MNDLWRRNWDGTNYIWTMESGSLLFNQSGIYYNGQYNIPGAREEAVTWTDGNNQLWLFGGAGYDTNGVLGGLNDLWRWDGIQWIWVAGSEFVNQAGVYGTSIDYPGARNGSISWIDKNNNLWLFGGHGIDANGKSGNLNDLWRWSESDNKWTWVAGSKLIGETGVYNAQLIYPGARTEAISWWDGNNQLWLFGGTDYDANGRPNRLSDLWRFEP